MSLGNDSLTYFISQCTSEIESGLSLPVSFNLTSNANCWCNIDANVWAPWRYRSDETCIKLTGFI